MKKLFVFMISLLSVVNVFAADNATKILDQAASKFKAAGGVLIGYSYDMNGETGKGTIKMQGKKFVNTTPKELAGINPYSFLDMYKSGYKASMGKSTATYYEVVLTSTSASNNMKNVVVHILKNTYEPRYVKLTTVDGVVNKVTVTKYAVNQKYNSDTFTFNPKKYPNIDIVDLR